MQLNARIKHTIFINRFQKISDFWKEFANDELDHTNLLIDIRNSLSEEQLESLVEKDHFDKISKTECLLTKKLTQKIESLNDAYLLAHDIESSKINNIFKFLALNLFPMNIQKNLL